MNLKRLMSLTASNFRTLWDLMSQLPTITISPAQNDIKPNSDTPTQTSMTWNENRVREARLENLAKARAAKRQKEQSAVISTPIQPTSTAKEIPTTNNIDVKEEQWRVLPVIKSFLFGIGTAALTSLVLSAINATVLSLTRPDIPEHSNVNIPEKDDIVKYELFK